MKYVIIIIAFLIVIPLHSTTVPAVNNAFEYTSLWKTTYDSIKSAIVLRDASRINRLTELSVFALWISTRLPEVIISPQRFIIDAKGNLSIQSNHMIGLLWKHPVANTNLLSINMTVTNMLEKEKVVVPAFSIGLSSGIAFNFGEDASVFPYVSPVLRFHAIGPLYLDIGISAFWNKIGFTGGVSFELQKKMYYSIGYIGSVYDGNFHSFISTGLTFDIW